MSNKERNYITLSALFYCPKCDKDTAQSYTSLGDGWVFGKSAYMNKYFDALDDFEDGKTKKKPELLCGRTTCCDECETDWVHHVEFKGIPTKDTMTRLIKKKVSL